MTDDLDPIDPHAAVDYYLETRQYDLSGETYQSHKYRLRSFAKWLVSEDHGSERVTNLNDVDLRTVHAYRVFKREENFDEDDPLNAVSMQGQVSTLRVFLNHLSDINAVHEDLHDRIRLPKVHDGEDVNDDELEAEDARAVLDYLHQWHYATRHHIVILLLWRTAMRRGGIHSLDVSDYDPDERALEVRHRPTEGTTLKNKNRGERDVRLKPHVATALEDYLEGPHRHNVTDEFGREPIITTSEGRPTKSTISDWVYKWTRPCEVGEPCPHNRDPETCEATRNDRATECPSSMGPHAVRTGSLTAYRDRGVSREVVSDRCDVSEKILDKHYDKASKRQQMRRRSDHLPEDL
jgi:integrase